jgi:acyl-CoA reductase-like NAD-dependent aldehyde dehydrogenase
MPYTSINPADGSHIQSLPEHTDSEIEQALAHSHKLLFRFSTKISA